MARREVTQYFDDLDNTPISEDQVHVIRFSVDGNDYLLDLSEKNAREFRDVLAPFIKVARPAPNGNGRGGGARVHPREIRRWAQNQGLAIAHRGKIPHEIIAAYNEAHA